MGLPVLQVPRDKFELPTGEFVEVRGLSRAEALQVRAVSPDVEAVEKLCLGFALDVSPEDVDEWYATAPSSVVEDLVNVVARLSGLDGDAGKADADLSRSAPQTPSTTSLPNSSTGA